MSEPIQYCDRMYALIETWQQSGLSKKVFCEQEGITYHRFHYWHQRYKAHHSALLPKAPAPAFIALDIPFASSASSAPASAELILPDGRRLLFHGAVDATYLKVLLS